MTVLEGPSKRVSVTMVANPRNIDTATITVLLGRLGAVERAGGKVGGLCCGFFFLLMAGTLPLCSPIVGRGSVSLRDLPDVQAGAFGLHEH